MKFAASVALIIAAAAAIIATSAMGQAAPSAPAPDQAAAQVHGDAAHGAEIFNTRCKDCHEPAVERAPNRDQLAAKTPDAIVTALTTGPMQPMAEGLSPEDKQAVAAYLTAKH